MGELIYNLANLTLLLTSWFLIGGGMFAFWRAIR